MEERSVLDTDTLDPFVTDTGPSTVTSETDRQMKPVCLKFLFSSVEHFCHQFKRSNNGKIWSVSLVDRQVTRPMQVRGI